MENWGRIKIKLLKLKAFKNWTVSLKMASKTWGNIEFTSRCIYFSLDFILKAYFMLFQRSLSRASVSSYLGQLAHLVLPPLPRPIPGLHNVVAVGNKVMMRPAGPRGILLPGKSLKPLFLIFKEDFSSSCNKSKVQSEHWLTISQYRIKRNIYKTEI